MKFASGRFMVPCSDEASTQTGLHQSKDGRGVRYEMVFFPKKDTSSDRRLKGQRWYFFAKLEIDIERCSENL